MNEELRQKAVEMSVDVVKALATSKLIVDAARDVRIKTKNSGEGDDICLLLEHYRQYFALALSSAK